MRAPRARSAPSSYAETPGEIVFALFAGSFPRRAATVPLVAAAACGFVVSFQREAFAVPFFVMGSPRCASADSRVGGLIPVVGLPFPG
jgi:hypothetical protein